MMMMIMIIKMIIIIIGITSKLFRKSLSNKPGTHGIMELQKTTILGTEHTVSWNYRKQPYWVLNTYSRKCECQITKRSTQEKTLRVPNIEITKQAQYYIL